MPSTSTRKVFPDIPLNHELAHMTDFSDQPINGED